MNYILIKLLRLGFNLLNKFLSKFFYLQLSFSLSSEIEKKIIKTEKLKDFKKKEKSYELLKKEYPENPLVLESYYLFLIENNKNIFHVLKNFDQFKYKWLKSLNLEHFNQRIIPWQVFCGSFGNCFNTHTLIEAKALGLASDEPITYINSTNKLITNPTLFSYFRKYIKIIENKDSIHGVSNFEKYFKIPLDLGVVPLKQGCFTNEYSKNQILQKKEKDKISKSFFELSEEHLERGKREIKKTFGIGEKDWFVTVHVRSGKTKNDQEISSFRNSNINKFIKSMKFIVQSGGYVFRMGNPKMEKLPKIEGVIDYAHHKDRNDFWDIYLGAKSKFHLGTNSGYEVVPDFFGVPYLISETTEVTPLLILKKCDLYLPRLIKDNKTGKKLNFRSYFNPDIMSLGFNVEKYLHNMNWSMIKNTEEDLLDATKEFLDRGKKFTENKINVQFGDLQKRYKILANQTLEKHFSPKVTVYSAPPEKFLEKNLELFE